MSRIHDKPFYSFKVTVHKETVKLKGLSELSCNSAGANSYYQFFPTSYVINWLDYQNVLLE